MALCSQHAQTEGTTCHGGIKISQRRLWCDSFYIPLHLRAPQYIFFLVHVDGEVLVFALLDGIGPGGDGPNFAELWKIESIHQCETTNKTFHLERLKATSLKYSNYFLLPTDEGKQTVFMLVCMILFVKLSVSKISCQWASITHNLLESTQFKMTTTATWQLETQYWL